MSCRHLASASRTKQHENEKKKNKNMKNISKENMNKTVT